MIVRFCNLDWSSPPYTYRSTTVRWHIYLELHNAHTHTLFKFFVYLVLTLLKDFDEILLVVNYVKRDSPKGNNNGSLRSFTLFFKKSKSTLALVFSKILFYPSRK